MKVKVIKKSSVARFAMTTVPTTYTVSATDRSIQLFPHAFVLRKCENCRR